MDPHDIESVLNHCRKVSLHNLGNQLLAPVLHMESPVAYSPNPELFIPNKEKLPSDSRTLYDATLLRSLFCYLHWIQARRIAKASWRLLFTKKASPCNNGWHRSLHQHSEPVFKIHYWPVAQHFLCFGRVADEPSNLKRVRRLTYDFGP